MCSGIEANGGAIGRFGFGGLPVARNTHAEIAVRIGMSRIDGDRLPVGGDRGARALPVAWKMMPRLL